MDKLDAELALRPLQSPLMSGAHTPDVCYMASMTAPPPVFLQLSGYPSFDSRSFSSPPFDPQGAARAGCIRFPQPGRHHRALKRPGKGLRRTSFTSYLWHECPAMGHHDVGSLRAPVRKERRLDRSSKNRGSFMGRWQKQGRFVAWVIDQKGRYGHELCPPMVINPDVV